jgi:hypothetical protein
MDRDLAKHVVAVGFHSLSLLESLIPILKKHCSADEYSEYLKAIGTVSAEVSTQIFGKVFQEHPDLEAEVEQKIKRYGQFI